MSDTALLTAESVESAVLDSPLESIAAEVTPEIVPAELAAESLVTAPDQRAAALTAVHGARDLPPGVRQRLTLLVQQAAALDAAGEPLLPTSQVLDLLSNGLPSVLRRETTTEVSRPEHPAGDAFFALDGDELSDQQAEQIARTQLQRAGLLRT